MIKTVSAYEARTNFGELINLAYYNGCEVIVERMGKPMVKIISVNKKAKRSKEKSLKDTLMKFAGIWSDKETEEIKANMSNFRRNFKIIR